MPRRWPAVWMTLGVLVAGCGEGSPVATTGTSDSGRGQTADVEDDRPERPLLDSATDDDETPDGEGADALDAAAVSVDAVVDDAFVRPTPDTDLDAPEDGPLDAALDTADDAAADDDAGPADAVVGELVDADPSFTLAGTTDCLRYEIEISNTDFDFKNEDIRITYFVSNVCATPWRVRTAHFSDFFPIAIEKNGEPWIFLPDCIGTGAPYEYTFEPAEGVNRGWIWNASDHEARMERCGVTFESDATYGVVGYGLTQLDMLDETSMSELVPITAPILITLRP